MFPKHPEQTNPVAFFHRSWLKEILVWHAHALNPRRLNLPRKSRWLVRWLQIDSKFSVPESSDSPQATFAGDFGRRGNACMVLGNVYFLSDNI